MLKYNNNHIFTGYLKQLLTSFKLPTCKIYTREFADYFEKHNTEDPRVLESFDAIKDARNARESVRISYLKNNELYHYFSAKPALTPNKERSSENFYWRRSSELFYESSKKTNGLTRSLNSPGAQYDNLTHEYLGEYLRFFRDYYNVNLMSLYNCFNNKVCNNIYFTFPLNSSVEVEKSARVRTTFQANDAEYKIYAIPVKLFSEYTIAIDCNQGIELFCGFYNTVLDTSAKAEELAAKTYVKTGQTLFNQPFLYNKLNVTHWPISADYNTAGDQVRLVADTFTRWDIVNREQDLKLFIKIPTSCKSSITILEGDYRGFNNARYYVVNGEWQYSQNHSVLNFNTKTDKIDLNSYSFKPISKLQLLAFNTGESYPFADRLIEYLIGSAITPTEDIPDNIKRAQQVMVQNKNYFRIEGIWENKMQNILYDYIMKSGPVEVSDGILKDKRAGINPRLGHNTRSTLYDVLGYVDKDAEKWYASWKVETNKAQVKEARVKDTIQNVDIYDGLYDI
jgi:hypothetical protein